MMDNGDNRNGANGTINHEECHDCNLMKNQLAEIRRQVESFEILLKNNPNFSPSLLLQNVSLYKFQLHRILGKRVILDSIFESTELDSKWDQVVTNFDGMCLTPDLLKGINEFGFEFPSGIQQRAIVPCISGWDVIAQAKGETGRTTAVVIALLQRINRSNPNCQVVFLTKTPETADKIQGMVLGLGCYMGISCQALSTPHAEDDIKKLGGRVQILVGTPADVLNVRKYLTINDDFKAIVIDDADQLLSGKFRDQTYESMKILGVGYQIILMSVALSEEILKDMKKIMRHPVTISATKDEQEERTLRGVREFYMDVKEGEEAKLNAVSNLYEQSPQDKALVFCNSVQKVEWIVKKMIERKHIVAAMHRDLNDEERQRILQEFRVGSIPMIIATDHDFGMEWDKHHISLIINYDFPKNPETYIWRLSYGRRFGRGGAAISFVTVDDVTVFQQVQNFFGTQIAKLPAEVDIIFPKF